MDNQKKINDLLNKINSSISEIESIIQESNDPELVASLDPAYGMGGHCRLVTEEDVDYNYTLDKEDLGKAHWFTSSHCS